VLGIEGQIWLSPGLLEQCLDAAALHRILIAIERVARHPHHLAGMRDVAQLRRQIQQAKLVFNDALVTIQHEGYLSCGFDGEFALPSNPVTLTFSSQVSDQVGTTTA